MDPYLQIVNTNLLGEGPHWNGQKGELIYVDIENPEVHRYVPATNEHTKVTIADGRVSLVVPVEGKPNQYIISVERTLRLMEWDGQSTTPTSLTTLATVEPNMPQNRFNDGKCDSLGRLWAGTMTEGTGPPQGTLYRLNSNGTTTSGLVTNVGTSNGLAWNSDNTVFYYIDTSTRKVDAFDYEPVAGTISNRRTVYDFGPNQEAGSPDGMTIDANGNLWVGCWGGAQIIQLDPRVGRKMQSISFPAANITSAAFGGPNLDILYVTSARSGLSQIDLLGQPAAGAVYQITNTGAKGMSAGYNYKMNNPLI